MSVCVCLCMSEYTSVFKYLCVGFCVCECVCVHVCEHVCVKMCLYFAYLFVNVLLCAIGYSRTAG